MYCLLKGFFELSINSFMTLFDRGASCDLPYLGGAIHGVGAKDLRNPPS